MSKDNFIINVEPVANCHEVTISINFSDDDAAQQAFKKALVDSFSLEKREEYKRSHMSSCLIDFNHDGENNITLTGLGRDLNSHFHSPPLVVPPEIQPEQRFWDVGNRIWDIGIGPYRDSAYTKYSEVHQDMYEDMSKGRIEENKKEAVRLLMDAVLAHDYEQIGATIKVISCGENIELSDEIIGRVKSHPRFSEIEEKFSSIEALKDAPVRGDADKIESFIEAVKNNEFTQMGEMILYGDEAVNLSEEFVRCVKEHEQYEAIKSRFSFIEENAKGNDVARSV